MSKLTKNERCDACDITWKFSLPDADNYTLVVRGPNSVELTKIKVTAKGGPVHA